MVRDAPPPAFTPGTAYKYSNLGYVVAAHVIEMKFKSNYEDMMSKYLFGPLKMDAQVPNVPITSYSGNAVGHSYNGIKDRKMIKIYRLVGIKRMHSMVAILTCRA